MARAASPSTLIIYELWTEMSREVHRRGALTDLICKQHARSYKFNSRKCYKKNLNDYLLSPHTKLKAVQ